MQNKVAQVITWTAKFIYHAMDKRNNQVHRQPDDIRSPMEDGALNRVVYESEFHNLIHFLHVHIKTNAFTFYVYKCV